MTFYVFKLQVQRKTCRLYPHGHYEMQKPGCRDQRPCIAEHPCIIFSTNYFHPDMQVLLLRYYDHIFQNLFFTYFVLYPFCNKVKLIQGIKPFMRCNSTHPENIICEQKISRVGNIPRQQYILLGYKCHYIFSAEKISLIS